MCLCVWHILNIETTTTTSLMICNLSELNVIWFDNNLYFLESTAHPVPKTGVKHVTKDCDNWNGTYTEEG